MVLEKLGESLKNTLSKIAKSLFVDEKMINELVKDIQRALLQADVNVKLVFELTNAIKQRAMKEEAPSGLTKKDQLVHIVYEELVKFLGGEGAKITVRGKPFKIMLLGLFGSGKTTTAGKLARFFSKRGYKVALLGLDVHRPAAMDQIEQIGKSLNVPVFTDRKEKNAVKIWKNNQKELNTYDIVIIDTAGRDALSGDLIKEIKEITDQTKSEERLLVISADIGQAAQKQADEFHNSCNITGVVATKMDGTAKAGGALTACAATNAPIKFIGVGEKSDALEEFRPEGFVSRLLGMGDLEALLEKAREAISEDEAEDLSKKLVKGEFNLIDLYDQMQAMKKMGPLNKIAEMIPGFGQIKMPKEMLNVQEEKLQRWRYIMDSMSKEELEDPELISAARIERIAKGAGAEASEVRELLKQYKQSKKLIKMLKPGNEASMNKMMKKFSSLQGMGRIRYK
ncbi:signal recognition particle protein [Candidatus Woesearchaeota archaeon]|nr:signal recognition particle protein [Candidatus Woesearchaeota archaeon]